MFPNNNNNNNNKHATDIERLTPLSNNRNRTRQQPNGEQQQQEQPQRAVPNNEICRFYALYGECRNGDNCGFSHVLPQGLVSWEDARKQMPCRFFAKGNCKYGDYCCFSHESSSTSTAETASYNPYYSNNKGYCCYEANTTNGHPYYASAEQQENEQEEEEEELELTCGICLENVLEANHKFGLLSGCDHVFCMDCLMNWRTEGSEEAANSRRCCPTCRIHSDYVVPSYEYAASNDRKNGGLRKQQIIDAYKNKLSKIECKRFVSNGRQLGGCQFGSDCFFAHLDEDGNDVKSLDLSMNELHNERLLKRIRRHVRDLLLDDLLYTMMMLSSSSESGNNGGSSGSGNGRNGGGGGGRSSTSTTAAAVSTAAEEMEDFFRWLGVQIRSDRTPAHDDDDDDDSDDEY